MGMFERRSGYSSKRPLEVNDQYLTFEIIEPVASNALSIAKKRWLFFGRAYFSVITSRVGSLYPHLDVRHFSEESFKVNKRGRVSHIGGSARKGLPIYDRAENLARELTNMFAASEHLPTNKPPKI